jgi:lipopolysaccharide biosynthesis regulator YciM
MPKSVKECEERGFHSFMVENEEYKCQNCGYVAAEFSKEK